MSREGQTGTLEKMIVANGNVAMDLDLIRLNGTASGTQESKRKAHSLGIKDGRLLISGELILPTEGHGG